MPTRRSRDLVLVDTSVAVALSVGDHERHSSSVEVLRGRRLGLAGHAAFESFSVLTRLPAPNRRPASAIARLLAANFPDTRFMSPDATAGLLAELEGGEISGGAVYDALVAAVARDHGAILATDDQRALDTYRVIGARIEVVNP